MLLRKEEANSSGRRERDVVVLRLYGEIPATRWAPLHSCMFPSGSGENIFNSHLNYQVSNTTKLLLASSYPLSTSKLPVSPPSKETKALLATTVRNPLCISSSWTVSLDLRLTINALPIPKRWNSTSIAKVLPAGDRCCCLMQCRKDFYIWMFAPVLAQFP